VSGYNKKSYKKNKEKRSLKNKEWRNENKEKLKKLINNCRKQRIINKNQLNQKQRNSPWVIK
jgi:hypothetical protein